MTAFPQDKDCILNRQLEITATDVGETKEYIGMTAGTFKERFANHKKSLNNVRYSTETELSKYAWKLKQSKRKFTIKWSIIKRVPSRAAGGSRCNLCLEEKLSLVRSDCERTLNKRSETNLARKILKCQTHAQVNLARQQTVNLLSFASIE